MSNNFSTRLLKGAGARVTSVFNNPYRKVNVSWLKEKYYKHLSAGQVRSHLLFGKPFYFYSPQEFLHGLKEIFIEELYRQDLPALPFIIDCGANMGLSVIYMKQQYPGAEIMAFEPDEMNFSLLQRNISSFHYENVTLHKAAVWKENTVLHFSNEGSMSSRISEDVTPRTTEVQAVRLRELLDRPVHFLKMDIEGAEFTVMADLNGRLEQVNNLFVEYHGTLDQQHELNELLAMLTANGFRYYIKEAASVYGHPFLQQKDPIIPFDIQLNIFCFRPR